MRVAHQVPAIFADKLIANEVERSRHMPAAIDIGIEAAAIVHEKGIDAVILADQPELLNRAGLELVHASDHPTAESTLIAHALLIAHKYILTDDQADQIKNHKKQRK